MYFKWPKFLYLKINKISYIIIKKILIIKLIYYKKKKLIKLNLKKQTLIKLNLKKKKLKFFFFYIFKFTK